MVYCRARQQNRPHVSMHSRFCRIVYALRYATRFWTGNSSFPASATLPCGMAVHSESQDTIPGGIVKLFSSFTPIPSRYEFRGAEFPAVTAQPLLPDCITSSGAARHLLHRRRLTRCGAGRRTSEATISPPSFGPVRSLPPWGRGTACGG